MIQGINRATEQKLAKISGPLKSTTENMLKAWPGTNIAKRIPVNDVQDIEKILVEYRRLFPEHLPHGVVSVEVAKTTDDFFMATNGKGKFWFSEIEYQGFNSRLDLLGGFAAIKSGQLLTQNQEYALETLWHEIWHNRQSKLEDIFDLDRDHPIRMLVESVNQYVSRLSYPGFIERLGGKAMHQEWVFKNGYGYTKQVNRLYRLFVQAGVDETIIGDLYNINTFGNLLQINHLLAQAIIKKSPNEKKLILNLLNAAMIDEQRFNVMLLLVQHPNAEK